MTNFKYLLVLLLFTVSCSVFKHKNKEKTKTELVKESQSSKKENNSIISNTEVESKDSTVTNFSINNHKSAAQVLQNFTLKNNGKCLDGGQLRFINFTDKNGNKTEIPVNDNTELNFSNSDAVLEENRSLKDEMKKMKETNLKLQDSVQYSKSIQEKASEKSSSSIIEIETKKESKSFVSYLFVAFAAVVFWELGKKYLKPK